MPAVCTTVAQLGTGDYDGQFKIIKYGPSGQEEKVGMRWRDDLDVWEGDKRLSVSLRDSWIMSGEGLAAGSVTWGYLYAPTGAAGQFGQSSYSFNPRAIRHADAAFTAGLTLQENLTISGWCFNGSDTCTLATVLYPKGPGDDISNLDVPDNYLSTQIAFGVTVRRFQTTGWVDSDVQACPKANLAPHLYTEFPLPHHASTFLEYLLAQWRWIGTP